MNRTIKLKRKLSIVLVGATIMAGAISTQGYKLSHSSGFSPYPTKIYCYEGFGTATIDAVKSACSAWNNAGAGTLISVGSSTHSNTDYTQNGKNEISKGARGTNTYSMQTMHVEEDSTTSYEVDIDINSSYAWATSGTINALDVQNAITHEIGHLLGLGDVTTNTEVTMYYRTQNGETKKRSLDSDDKSGILAIY